MANIYKKDKVVYCCDSRECFAKKESEYREGVMTCTILKNNYEDGKCPFCKPERAITNGKHYPWDSNYASNMLTKKEEAC